MKRSEGSKVFFKFTRRALAAALILSLTVLPAGQAVAAPETGEETLAAGGEIPEAAENGELNASGKESAEAPGKESLEAVGEESAEAPGKEFLEAVGEESAGASGKEALEAAGAVPGPEDAADDAFDGESIADSDIAVTNEMIVVYDDAGVSEAKSEKIKEQAEEALDDMDAEITDEVIESNEQQGTVVVAEIPEDVKLEEAIEQIEADDNVSFAQPNFIYSALGDVEMTEVTPEDAAVEEDMAGASDAGIKEQGRTNDAVYNDQVDRVGSQYLNYLEAARVYEAWDRVQADKSVTVAVLDSGCRLDHEDLQHNILKSYAYDSYYDRPLTAGTVPNGGDATGHGTHVCGLIAAEADNGVGIAGTSYNANILPVKIFDNYGNGATTTTFLKGIEYCRQLIDSGKVDDLRVINMSVGYYTKGTAISVDHLLENAIGIMADYYDVLCVCSGGNGNSVTKEPYEKPMYPSDFEDCLSVTALDENNYNCSWSDYNESKDISAPGKNIVSTYHRSRNSYYTLTGTSMAAPIVSGICALLFAENPSLTVDEVKEAVEVTANSNIIQYRNESRDMDRRAKTGSHGAIDAAAALDYVSDKNTARGSVSIGYAQITGINASYEYTGGKIRPVPTVKISGAKLKKNSDYTVTYSNNTSVSTSSSRATVTIEGIGGYKGTIVKDFTIVPKDISKCAISLSGTRFAYTGSAVKPAVTISVSSGNSMKLKKDIDYTVTYAKNVEPGTASVTIKATGGSYKGSVVKNFTITKANIGSLTSTLSPSAYIYNKKARKPAVTVRNGQTALAKGKDYTVSYSNNVKAGVATVKIIGKGSRYTGTVTKTFSINPRGTKLSKLAKKSKGFSAKWKKQATQTTGYQIQYSVNKDFSGAKTKTVKKAKTTEASVSGLKKGQVYYVRIRTYKKSNGRKCCSDWSKAKKVRTK